MRNCQDQMAEAELTSLVGRARLAAMFICALRWFSLICTYDSGSL